MTTPSTSEIVPGMLVRHTTAFCQSTFLITPPIDGLVRTPPKDPERSPKWEQEFLYVQWCDSGLPVWVRKTNVELCPIQLPEGSHVRKSA